MTQRNPARNHLVLRVWESPLGLAAAVLVLLLTASPFAAADAECSAGPKEVVACISRDVADAVHEQSGGELEGIRQRLQLIEDAASPHTDFPYMAELVLGDAWRHATPEQQTDFVEAFRSMLLWTFAEQVARHADESMTFQAPLKDPTGQVALVRTKVRPSVGPSMLVDYRLRILDGRWRVFDVAVDGVSIVSLFRSDFRHQARRHGLDGLTRQLVARNQRLKDT